MRNKKKVKKKRTKFTLSLGAGVVKRPNGMCSFILPCIVEGSRNEIIKTVKALIEEDLYKDD